MGGSTQFIIAGNWKMNGLLQESLAFVEALTANPNAGTVEMVICPPYTLLHPLAKPFADKGVTLGAENMYFEESGAFTGSISAGMLKDAGCEYVILGHSERRDIMLEGNKLLRKKLDAAWDAGLTPMFCIGEHLGERESGSTNDVLKQQLSVLADTDTSNPLVIAYEPVWAIGTGKTASPEQVAETHAFVHQELARLGRKCKVLYGGSVNSGNAESLMACEGVDGALVGGASLKADSFMEIVAAAARVAA
ncbi:MAG: triose-phosphate isomerase [Ghiorsea sp.]|nr:triose-phosphate isomerase [Ghiorsea sp.]